MGNINQNENHVKKEIKERKMDTPILLSKVTSTKPPRISKGYSLIAGELRKNKGGNMAEGYIEQLAVGNIAELAKILTSLTTADALVYGISDHKKARIVTKAKLKQSTNGGDPVIARSKDFIRWNRGHGVFMLDADFPTGTMDPEEYLGILYGISPDLKESQHLLTHSASSHIYKGKDCLKGAGGLRVLIAGEDATDFQRAGKVLFQKLILAGHGYAFISKSGSFYPRTLTDAAVYGAERLDFAGGAHCTGDLTQRRPDPVVYNRDGSLLDTREALPDLTPFEAEKYQDIVDSLRAESADEAQEIQGQWKEERIVKALAKIPDSEHEEETPRLDEMFSLAVKHKKLLGDYEITLDDHTTVTVLGILEDKDKYHGRRCFDPLEPDYDGGRVVGWINARAAGRPYIHSFAHGGCRFTLHTARGKVLLTKGERFGIVQKCLGLIRLNGQHYDRGGEMVNISNSGEIIPRKRDDIQLDLDGMVAFFKYLKSQEIWVPEDCPPPIAVGAMSARATWGLPKLTGVSQSPIIDPVTGRLIETDGYDSATGLMLVLGNMSRWPGVPDNPTNLEVEDALYRLWVPFEKFPFDGAVSKGVLLSTLLTATIRPLLPTSPGTGFDSPTPGSGKTKLCQAIAALKGETAGLLPDVKDNEEMRKRILPLLRSGKGVMILDNVTGRLNSSVLCTMLTAKTYQDRVLGASENVELPNKLLLLISGNNIDLRGDLCRRVFKCRIDPQIAEPWKRAFKIDPVQYIENNRLRMVADCLTILRAGIQRGPTMPDRTASFELWSDTARRAVCLVRDLDLMTVADPVESIDTNYELDPEMGKMQALMGAWFEVFGSEAVRVNDLISKAEDTYSDSCNFNPVNLDLKDALLEIAGEGRNINSRRLGRWIERNRDRIVDSMRIVFEGKKHGANVWAIGAAF